jgi:hypothetical protein
MKLLRVKRLRQPLRDLYLLAQVVAPFLSCIHCENNQQTKHHQKEENFHAVMIAGSREFVLCREFADTKQLCKVVFGFCCRQIPFTDR